MLIIILQKYTFEKVAIKVVSTQDIFAPQKITKSGKVRSKEGSKSRKRRKKGKSKKNPVGVSESIFMSLHTFSVS